MCRSVRMTITMPIRTSLSEDTTIAALNTKAHAPEHCAIDRESLDVLNSAVGRQVLVTRTAKRLALYTIAARIDVAGPTVRVGTVGLARVEDPTGEPPAPKLKAALETDFLGGAPTAPVRLTEDLLGTASTGLAVMAPHGGRIEPGTDDQAGAVYELLAKKRKPVRAWIAQGFDPAGAHRCWHITASQISEHSFPGLSTLFGGAGSRGPFAHAVAFHGQNDSDAIIVGGGLAQDATHTALKARLRDQLRDALRAVTEHPPAVVVRRSGPLAGIERANIVNRVTVRGNGIQLEQPAAVRADDAQRAAVVRAVAAFYAELI
jgi:phage replication-related protein YjqB (UPF0714/DUF867 family)